jgi:WD40 repeat protein
MTNIKILGRMEQPINKGKSGTSFSLPESKEPVLTADSLNNYALSMLDSGKPEEAEEYWDEALKKNPGHLESTYNQGLHQWRSAKINDDELLRRLRDAGQTAELLRVAVMLTQVHLERGDCEETIRLLEALSEADRIHPEVAKLLNVARNNQTQARRVVRVYDEQKKVVCSVCFSPDGRYALSGDAGNFGKSQQIKLWSVETGQCVRTFEELGGILHSVCFSPDGRYVLSGTAWANSLKLWEMDTGLCMRTFEGHTEGVKSACFSPDGRYAVSGEDKATKLWDVETGQCVRTFDGHSDNVQAVRFSPDGQYVLSGSDDNTIKLWAVDTGRCARTFNGHELKVNSACFSADGRYILSGSNDMTMKKWEVTTGLCVRTFDGHKHWVHSVCFSPDGRYALSGSRDETMKMWKVETGQCIRTFDTQNKVVYSVCFSPDGRYALSGGLEMLRLTDIRLAWNYSAPWLLTKSDSEVVTDEPKEAFINPVNETLPVKVFKCSGFRFWQDPLKWVSKRLGRN